MIIKGLIHRIFNRKINDLISNMIEKLRQLETRRLFFLKMCSPSRQSSYSYCQETKLVRVVLDHINPEYDDCIARLLDFVKVNKMLVSVSSGVQTHSRLLTHMRGRFLMNGFLRGNSCKRTWWLNIKGS